jgi:adenylylsulfate kinase
MATEENPQIVWHQESITRTMRDAKQGHRSGVVWFTGLSGSGKSTVANAVDQLLFARGIRTFLLDGDNVRHSLCATPALLAPVHGDEYAKRFGLGFGPQDREENIRRVGASTELLVSAGLIVLTAFVSPYRRDRDRVRERINKLGCEDSFLEIFVNTPLEICEQRDPKGLYQQARAGKITNFTGISDPYEPPVAPELELKGGSLTPTELAEQTIQLLLHRNWIKL